MTHVGQKKDHMIDLMYIHRSVMPCGQFCHISGPSLKLFCGSALILFSDPESELNVCHWLLKHGPKDEDVDDKPKQTEKTNKVLFDT